MLVTGAKRADEINNFLLKLMVTGLSGGAVDGLTVHRTKLAQRKISNTLYLKNIRSEISDHYKNKQ